MARPLALVPALALILGGVACSSDVPEPAVSQSSTPAAVESPTSTEPAPELESPEPSPSETAAAFQGPDVNLTDEQQEAVDTVEEFFHYYDKALEDPGQSISELADLTEGELLANLTSEVGQMQTAGIRQKGELRRQVESVASITEINGVPTTTVIVCADGTDLSYEYVEDSSPVEAEPLGYIRYEFTLDKDSRWVLRTGTNQQVDSCVG